MQNGFMIQIIYFLNVYPHKKEDRKEHFLEYHRPRFLKFGTWERTFSLDFWSSPSLITLRYVVSHKRGYIFRLGSDNLEHVENLKLYQSQLLISTKEYEVESRGQCLYTKVRGRAAYHPSYLISDVWDHILS